MFTRFMSSSFWVHAEFVVRWARGLAKRGEKGAKACLGLAHRGGWFRIQPPLEGILSSPTEAVTCSSSAIPRALECRLPCCQPRAPPLRRRPSRQPARCENSRKVDSMCAVVGVGDAGGIRRDREETAISTLRLRRSSTVGGLDSQTGFALAATGDGGRRHAPADKGVPDGSVRAVTRHLKLRA